MRHSVRRRFLVTVCLLFFAANLFAQVAVRRSVTPPKLTTRIPVATIATKTKVRPLYKKYPTKIFGSGVSHGLLTSHTTITGNKGKITFDIEMGEPTFSKSKEKVVGADDRQFGKLSWSNLNIEKLPTGVSFTNIGKAGEPEIPALAITIAIPEGASNFVPILQQTSSGSLTSTFLLPRSDTKGERFYSQNNYRAVSPSSPILSGSAKIRTMRIVALTIPLVEFNAASGTAKAKKKFTCGIFFDLQSQLSSPQVTNTADPVFEQLYSRLAANTSDIARFRSGFHSHPVKQGVQTAAVTPTFDKSIVNWIDPSASYIKLVATRTGLYRVTPAEIQSRSGSGDIQNWRASELRMFNRGKEVPVWIDSTADGKINAIEYYGERQHGFPGEYYSWETDSNAYWLTNSRKFQTAPKRYFDKVVTGNPSLTISEGNITLHHEQDNFYYGGDAGRREDSSLQRFEWIAGERFVWRMVKDSTTKVIDTFNVASLPSDITGKSATISFFLRGISTANGGIVTHHETIRINGIALPDVGFSEYNELRTSFTVPLSQLKLGANTFEVAYKAGNLKPDQWYFDFYEVSLPESLSANSDTAIAKGQWALSLVPTQQEFNLLLQASGEVPHLYNLSDDTKLITNGNAPSYKDAASGTTKYVAAISSSFLHPDRIVNASGTFAAILDSTIGADYIIITHPLFMQTALTLAKRRHDFSGLRTKVVSTDEVFNAFSFGSDEAWAIRRYLQYAFDFYNGVPPAFVTLFGDATWDPKFNLNNPLQDNPQKTIHRSYVPTYGNPSSDYVFTTVEGTGFTDSSTFRMVVTRIPVETQDEAQNYLNKLVDYETSSPAQWNKNFLFVAGGDPPTQWGELLQDEQLYVGLPPYQGNQFGGLGNPPISIKPTFIYRHNLIDPIDGTQIANIQTAFQEGQALCYFFGHGAPNITDVQFPDVTSLRNLGRYPVLITVSCRTGAFAEPNIVSMNESFVRVPQAGAILALGSTGFGAVDYDFSMSADIFNLLRADTGSARIPLVGAHKLNMPIVMTTSKFIESILQSDAQIETNNFGPHNSLYEYTILGDAAIGFDLRPQPEFNIVASDILLMGKDSIPRTVFSLRDSEITVKVTTRNFGYGITKPVHIRLTENQPGNRQIILIDSITSFENIATTGAVFSLDSFAVGSNNLNAFVDFDNQFAETDEDDNEASVSFLVNGVSATPFYPPEGSKYFCDIRTDSVNFILLLPHTATGGATTLELQFDTTNTFTNPKDYSGLKGSGLFFQKAFARSELPNPSSHVIWCRSRITLQSGAQSSWEVQSLSVDAPKPSGARSEFSYSTGDQLERTIISGLQVDKTDGALFIPTTDTVQYDVEARGLNDTNVVAALPVGQLLLKGRPAFTTPYISGQFVAFSLLEMTADSSGIDQQFLFLKTDVAGQGTILANELVADIAAIPDGRKVVAMTNFAPFIPNFTNSDIVKQALQTLGSANGMGAVSTFGSYALIGRKGMLPGQAKEKFSGDHTGGVSLLDTVITLGTTGFAQTPMTASATGYGNLRWKSENVSPNSTIKFTVLGVRKIGGAIDTVLKADAASGTSADLSVNPASFYDKMYVQMNFQRSASSSVSPKLNLIELEYDPAPEFNTSDSLISVNPKVVLEGNTETVTYQVQNVTCVDAQKVPVQLVQTFHGKATIIATDTIANFLGHSTVSFTHTLLTSGFQGDVSLTATVNPGATLNEQLAFNNSTNIIYTVVHDSTKPKLDLLFDGNHINSGDYVSSKVVIEIRLSDNSPLRVMDSSSISGTLQALFGATGPQVFSGRLQTKDFRTRFVTQPTGVVQAFLDITPETPLAPGRYLFTAVGNDASGNRADTLSDEFVVSNTNGLDHVMNYPNPFKDKTWFTFILKAGSQADVKVVVYTVAGRKIRTIHVDPAKQRAGLNSLEWDGRDEMGNDVANGTYLYRVVLNGTNDDGSASSDAITERAVRSR